VATRAIAGVGQRLAAGHDSVRIVISGSGSAGHQQHNAEKA
jgi:hypothetical protein